MIIWKNDAETLNGRYAAALTQMGSGGITWVAHDSFTMARKLAFKFVKGNSHDRVAIVWDRKDDKMAAFAGPDGILDGFDHDAFRADLKAAVG